MTRGNPSVRASGWVSTSLSHSKLPAGCSLAAEPHPAGQGGQSFTAVGGASEGPRPVRDPGQEAWHRGQRDAGGTWSSQAGLDCHS